MSSTSIPITRVPILGGKPPKKIWDNLEFLPPSTKGWLGSIQKPLLRAGLQPVPLHIRQPQVADWSEWRNDLTTYHELFLESHAAHTIAIGQSAGATALLWLMQEYAGFGVRKLIMVDPWKPGPESEHRDFRRAHEQNIDRDLRAFRKIGEIILVISSDDDEDHPEVAVFTEELIAQVALARQVADQETISRNLDVPVHSAEITIIDMPGRKHFVQLDSFPEMLGIVTANRGTVGQSMIDNHEAVALSGNRFQLPALVA